MGQCKIMPRRYFNHGLPKDHPKFWWYFQVFRTTGKVRTRCRKSCDWTWCPIPPIKISAQYLNPSQFYKKNIDFRGFSKKFIALHGIAHNFLCSQNFDPIKEFLYVRRINLMEKNTLGEIWNIDVSGPARFSRGMTLNIKKSFRKIWSQIPLFQQNSTSGINFITKF